MGAIKFANWRAWRAVEHIPDVIDICILNPEERNQWKDVFSSYMKTIQVCHSILICCLSFMFYIYVDFKYCLDFQALQQKTDFTDEEIEAFQLQADEFFCRWTALAGYDDVTNYIHVLGAGHIRYYLQKWRNLN
jgi:hypothetical protein